MSLQNDCFLAIVNPAAGGGKSAKLAETALAQLRQKGIVVDAMKTAGKGHAAQLAAQGFAQGYRKFIAVGGDGTAHEILNGLFVQANVQERVSLGFLPLGTGNSFLRDFATNGADASLRAMLVGSTRPIDLVRLTHASGELVSLNILSLGFTADVGSLTNRYFKPLGSLGYLLGVFVRVAQLRRRSFPLRCDDDSEWDDRRALFLTFNNSKYTGGKMLIAPHADAADGFIEFVRWGPIDRLGLLRTLPRLFDGTHIEHPLASRRAVRHVEFKLPAPVDIMIDGEIVTLNCKAIDILPGVVDVFV